MAVEVNSMSKHKFDVMGYCKVCGEHALKNLSGKNCIVKAAIEVNARNFDWVFTKWKQVGGDKRKFKTCPICKDEKADMRLVESEDLFQRKIIPKTRFLIGLNCLNDVLGNNSEVQTFLKHKIKFVYIKANGRESKPFTVEKW